MILRALLSLFLPPLRCVFPPFPYLIYCLFICFESLSHVDFSPLTHLPLAHLIPRSLLSSWNWEKSSPVSNTKHQLQAPFLLRFLPCLLSAVSVGSVFSKIIHGIEKRDLITVGLFVLFKMGRNGKERPSLLAVLLSFECRGFSHVLMYPRSYFSLSLRFCSPDNCFKTSC